MDNLDLDVLKTALAWKDTAWPWSVYGPVVMAAVRQPWADLAACVLFATMCGGDVTKFPDKLVERGDDGKERVLVELSAAEGKRLRAAAALALAARAAATAPAPKAPGASR